MNDDNTNQGAGNIPATQNPGGAPAASGGQPAPAAEKTYTQAELDRAVQSAVRKSTKGIPGEEELKQFHDWQDAQKTEQERWNSLTKERDESRAALEAATAELEQLRRERYVTSKGLSGEEAEFLAFKAAKMVTDTKSFEQAADELFAQRQTQQTKKQAGVVTFDWTAPVGANAPGNSVNDAMNALIRGAVR